LFLYHNMKPGIKIYFTDFWTGFDKKDNFFYNLLCSKYNVVIDHTAPDLLFFSCYGTNHLKFKCTKIFYTAENVRPDFTVCDYALTFDHINNPRHFRLPLYVLYIERLNNLRELLNRTSVAEATAIWNKKKKFCCMVVSNAACEKRIEFFKHLSRYKTVDSGGKVLNNVGGPVADKLAFISDYKFVISFENTSYPGYVTEKILESFATHTIPVYWGSTTVKEDFNPQRFVNYADFTSEKKLIDHLLKLDADDAACIEMISSPVFAKNKIPDCLDDAVILNFLKHIISHLKKHKPVSQTLGYYLHKNRVYLKAARTNTLSKLKHKLKSK